MSETITPRLLTQIGVSTSFLALGFAWNASSLTVPLVADLPAPQATAFFKPFFYNGGMLVVPAQAAAAVALGSAAYLLSRADTPVAKKVAGYSPVTLLTVGAVTALGGLPFTRLAMMGVINRLLELAESPAASTAASGEVVQLLGKWKVLNLVRAGFITAAGVLGQAALVGQL